MDATSPCPDCAAANLSTARFCTKCGATLRGRGCTGCGAPLQGGAFCNQCGQPMKGGDAESAAVQSETPWVRQPGDFVRRVPFVEMRSLFDHELGAAGGQGFWGSLLGLGHGAIERLRGVYIDVPIGSVAVVVFDGEVTDILPSGRRAVSGFISALVRHMEAREDSKSLIARLSAALTSGASAAVEEVLTDRLARTAIFLVDTRPIPVLHELKVAGSDEDHAVEVGVVASAHVAGRTDSETRDAYGVFLSRVVGAAEAVTAQSLRDRLLPHVERIARDALERTRTAAGPDIPQAQGELAARLAAEVGDGIGLRVDLALTLRGAVASLRLHLGQSSLPDVRRCVDAECSSEVKAGQRYCVGCGGEQPTPVSPRRICEFCAENVPAGKNKCPNCETAFEEADPRTTRLLTQDGELVELDLVVRVQGDREIREPNRVVSALVSLSQAAIRAVAHDSLCGADGFRALEATLTTGLAPVVAQLNLQLLGVSVLDVRGRTQEWLLGVEAQLVHARAELTAGREWLAVDEARIGLQESTLTLVRRRLQVERDSQLASDEAEISDRESRQALEDREAALELGNVRRGAQTAVEVDEATREAQRTLDARAAADKLAAIARDQTVESAEDAGRRAREAAELLHQTALEAAAGEHDEAQAIRSAKLQSNLGRQATDDAAYSAQSRLEQQRAQQRAELEKEQAQLDMAQTAADREAERRRQQAAQAMEMRAAMDRADAEREGARLAAAAQGVSATNILAAQATSLAGAAQGAAVAQALAGALGQQDRSAVQAEMYERMLKDRDASQNALLGMAQQMAGAHQGQQDKTLDAYRNAAEQARSMSEKSMAAMATVASSSAKSPQQVIVDSRIPPTRRSRASEQEDVEEEGEPVGKALVLMCGKPGCGQPLAVGERFCMHCGTKVGG